MIPNTIWKTQPKEKSCHDSEQLNFGTQFYQQQKTLELRIECGEQLSCVITNNLYKEFN